MHRAGLSRSSTAALQFRLLLRLEMVIWRRETLTFMLAKLQCVVLDCADVVELSGFYQSLLGGVVNQPDPRWSLGEGWATLHADDGFVLAFQRVVDHRPPQWPDASRPQQFHLDLEVEDLGQAQEKILKQGATLLAAGDGKRSWRIFADPAGHPFCLVRH